MSNDRRTGGHPACVDPGTEYTSGSMEPDPERRLIYEPSVCRVHASYDGECYYCARRGNKYWYSLTYSVLWYFALSMRYYAAHGMKYADPDSDSRPGSARFRRNPAANA